MAEARPLPLRHVALAATVRSPGAGRSRHRSRPCSAAWPQSRRLLRRPQQRSVRQTGSPRCLPSSSGPSPRRLTTTMKGELRRRTTRWSAKRGARCGFRVWILLYPDCPLRLCRSGLRVIQALVIISGNTDVFNAGVPKIICLPSRLSDPRNDKTDSVASHHCILCAHMCTCSSRL